MDMTKVALVTHQGCMDGSTCAIVFVAAGGLRENVFFSSPNHRDTDEIVSDLLQRWTGPILIADASISLSLAEKIYRQDIVLLDHHKSAIPLTKFPWCEIDVDNTRAGGKMLYDWLKKNSSSSWFMEYENLVTFADDHDRWIKEYKQSDVLSLFHEVLGQELFIDRFLKNSGPALNAMEQYAVDLEVKKREKYIQKRMKEVEVVRKKIQGHDVNVAYVSAGTHQSLLGNMICEDPTIGADICVLVGSSVSMRANRLCPVDLSAVAKINGGGGHAKAAGCSIDKLLGKSLVEYVKDNLRFQ